MRKVLLIAVGALLASCTLSTLSLSDLSAPTTGVPTQTATTTPTGTATPPPTPTPPCNPSFFSAAAMPGTTQGQVLLQVTADSWSLSNETAGDLLVAVAYGGQSPGSQVGGSPTVAANMSFNVSDSLGNTYYAGPLVVETDYNQAAIQIFYAPNIQGGANKVTATSIGGPSVPQKSLWTAVFLQEYAGVATNDVVDISSGQAGAGAPPAMQTLAMTPGPMVTTRCDLIVGAFTDGHVDGQTLESVVDPSWPYRSTDDFDPAGAVDDAPDGVPANTTVNAQMNLVDSNGDGPDGGWVATQMAFRASNWSATPQPAQLAFATPARTAAAGACSPPVTLKSESSGVAVTTAKGITVELGAVGLSFYADASCLYPVTSVYLGAGTRSTTFYFKGSSQVALSTTIDATATGFTAISQPATVN